MVEEFPVGLDARRSDRSGNHARRLVGGAERQVPARPETGEGRAIFHDHCLQLAVIDARVRREADVVAVLAAVGKRNQQRISGQLFVVENDPVTDSAVSERFAKPDPNS